MKVTTAQIEQRRNALRAFIERRLEETPNAWCKRAGVSSGAVRNFLSGHSRTLNESTYRALAAAAGVTIADLLGEAPLPRLVPLVGYVGAGAEIHPFDDHEHGDGMEMVDPAPGADETMVAVRVRGASMLPVFMDGDVLYYRRDFNFIAGVCLNNICVVKVRDGATLVKQLLRGSEPGRYTLLSQNAPPIENVEIEWAAPVGFVDMRGRFMGRAA